MNQAQLLQPLRLASDLTATHCEPIGTKPRGQILFLHGMNAGAWQFEALQPFFAARGYESIALNYRGHHGSRPIHALGRAGVRDYVDDALTAARALGRPIVVGQSMGGLIAQKLAEADAVSAAVLLCSLPPRGIVWRSTGALLVPALCGLAASVRGSALLASRAQLDALLFNCMEPHERAAFYQRQVPESGRVGLQIALGLIGVDAARVRCPVLSVGAEHDRLVLPSVASAIARKYRAQLVQLRDCGHYALVGEPGWEPRACTIAAWLEQLERESMS